MMDQKQIAWGITLLAASAGLWMLWRRRSQSNPLSLLYTKTYYPEYDMSTTETVTHMDTSKLPRGYRNNNPLNIRISSNKWNGKVSPNTDGAYEQFIDLVHGYRAALVLLRNYIKNGYNTIEKMITRWAPESDSNYTSNYIANVSRLTGIDKNQLISRDNKESLCKIAYAMSISENGYKDKDENDIKETYGLPDMDIIYEAWEKI